MTHETRFGVLATPDTEMPGRTNCHHPQNRRRDGERQPAAFGTWATEECTLCGAWRTTGHVVGHWRPASEPRGRYEDRYEDE